MSSPDPRAHDRSDEDYKPSFKDTKKKVAKKMSKSDRKAWHKATRKLGKITDGGGRPYSKEEIFNSLKADTRVGRDMKIWREHNN